MANLFLAILPGLVVAGLIFGANIYYNLDTQQIIMEEITKISNHLLEATAGFTVSGGATSISGTGATVNPSGAITLTAGTTSVWKTDSGALTIQSADTLTATSTNEMIFATAGQERMRIDTSGNVGIATTTPAHPLVVNSAASNAFVVQSDGKVGIGTAGPTSKLDVEGTTSINWQSSAESYGLVTLGTSGSGGSLFVHTPSFSSIFSSGFGVDGSYSGGKSVINLKAFGTKSGGPYSSEMALYTSDEGVIYERIRIDNQGNVGIGTTDPASLLELYKLGSTGPNPVLTITNASTTIDIDPTIVFKKASTDEWKIYMDDSDSDKLKIATTTADIFTLDQSGNLQIDGNLTVSGAGFSNFSGDLNVRGGAVQFYSTEAAKTDVRLTFNVADADKSLIYNYDESGTTFHDISIGGPTGTGLLITSTGNASLLGDLTVTGGVIRIDSGIAEPQFLQIDTGTRTWQVIVDNSPEFLGFYDGATYLLTLHGGGDIDISTDLNIEKTVVDGNPFVSLGKDANDRIVIQSYYNTGTTELDVVSFTTASTGAGANDGRIYFASDGNAGLLINPDQSVQFYGSLTGITDLTMSGTTFSASSATASFSQLNVTGTTTLATSEGRVGIATTTPSYELHVWGSAGFGTSTTPTLYVDSGNGRVGIGTTTLTSKLHIETSAWNNSEVPLVSIINMDSDAVDSRALFVRGGADNTQLTIEVQDWTGNTDFVITGLGNVGIGTTPFQRLTIRHGHYIAWPTVAEQANSRSWGIRNDYDNFGDFSIRSSDANDNTLDTTRLVINKDGNVGIATTTPAYPLVVNSASANAFIVDSSGNVIVAGDLTVSGNDIKDSGENIMISFNGTDEIDVLGYVDVSKATTNATKAWIDLDYDHTASVNGSYYNTGHYVSMQPVVNTGISDTGYERGFFASMLTASTQTGTLKDLIGVGVQVGTYTDSEMTVTNAYGVNIAPYHISGAITNYYGFYHNIPAQTASVTNSYGAYIRMPATYAALGNEAAGYFSGDGRSVTIANTNYAISATGDVNFLGNLSVTATTTLATTEGNVGIGTTSPTTGKLVINNGSVDIASFDGSTIGLKLAGNLITANAAEINYLDGVTGVGIANDNLMLVDDADAADNDYAKFTTNGLEGRSYKEVLDDLSGNYLTLTTGLSGAPYLRASQLNNLFYAADKRFTITKTGTTITYTPSGLFDNDYEDIPVKIGDGNTVTLNLSLIDKGEYSSHLIYSYGKIVVHFYSTYNTESVRARVKTKNAGETYEWRDWVNGVDISRSGSYHVMVMNMQNNYLCTEVEVEITASGNDVWPSEIEWNMDRALDGRIFPLVQKYNDNNLYGDLYFKNSANTQVASITSAGDAYFAGNVGIATTTPDYKLHVWGSAGFGTSTTPTLYVDSGGERIGIGTVSPGTELQIGEVGSDDIDEVIRLQTKDGGYYADIGARHDSNNAFYIEHNGQRILTSTGDAYSLITYGNSGTLNHAFSGGKVGIATTTPQAKLHVVQTGAVDAFRVDDSTNETTPFVIDQLGKVGIGTASPGTKLDISGVVSDDGIRVTGGGNDIGLFLNNTGTGGVNWFVNSTAGTSGYGQGKLTFGLFAASPVVTIQSNANIGISTTTPSAKLSFASATTAAGGIAFGLDTNLYRSAADTLKTDDALAVGGDLTVGYFTVSSNDIVSADHIELRTAGDESMYFDAGGTFYWRDIDASSAIRMSLDSSNGNLSVSGDLTVSTDLIADPIYIGTDKTSPKLTNNADALELYSGSTPTLALTLETNQDAKFKGAVYNQLDNEGYFTGIGNDLRIYHDGTNSFIANSTGNLYVDTTSSMIFRTNGSTQALQLDTSQNATFAAHVFPDADISNDLGSTTSYWRYAYVNRLYLGSTGVSDTYFTRGNVSSISTNDKITITHPVGESDYYLANRSAISAYMGNYTTNNVSAENIRLGSYFMRSYANMIFLDAAYWSIDYAFYYNGASYTDRTSMAKYHGGSAFTILADTDDYFYWGDAAKWALLYIDLSTLGGGLNLTWEYSQGGASWATLTLGSDGTSGLTQDGWITWSFPGDWATDAVNGQTKYWIRVKTSSVTTGPTATLTDASVFYGDFVEAAVHYLVKFRVDYNGNISTAGVAYLGDNTEDGTVQNSYYFGQSGGEHYTNTDIRPSSADSYDLGTTTYEWANFYLGEAGKIYFRLDQSVNLYGSATDMLKTDDSFTVGGDLTVSGGNVGIGTTPSYAIDIEGVNDVNVAYRATRYVDTAYGVAMYMRKARGTSGTPLIVNDNDDLFAMAAYGYDGNSFENAAQIIFEVDETPGDGDMPGRIVFKTTPDGSVALTTALTLDSLQNATFAGNLTVSSAGTLTVSGTGTHSFAGPLSITGTSVIITKATNDGNPYFQAGSSSNDRFFSQAVYNTGTQVLDRLDIRTVSAGSGDDGRIVLDADGTGTFTLYPTGNATLNGDLTVSGNDIMGSTNALIVRNTTTGGTLSLYSTNVWNDGAALALDDDADGIKFLYDGTQVFNVRGDGEIDITGTGAWIDLNPAGTGSKNIIDITPSASLAEGSSWKSIYVDMQPLDPATGVASSVAGMKIEASLLRSVDNDASVYGYMFYAPDQDSSWGFYHSMNELDVNKNQNGYLSYGTGAYSTTATYRGLHLSWATITRDANAPVLEGIRVDLPADYTDFGANFAGYFSGDGRSVKICDTTYALDVSGAMNLTGAITGVTTLNTSGNVTVGGDLTVSGTTFSASSATGSFSQLNVTATTTLATTQGNVGIGTTGPTYKLDIYGTGDLLRIASSTGDIFKVSETQIESVVPHSFTSAGDVSIAYDLQFTNQTASYIKSNAPLYIEAGEIFESNDLTLRTFNNGDLVFDLPGGVTFAQGQSWDLADSTTTALNIESGLLNLDTQNSRVGIATTTPSVRLAVQGDILGSGNIVLYGTATSTFAGPIEITGFKMTTEASNSYVLTSNASGYGTWQAATGGGGADTDWIVNGSIMYATTSVSYVGIATTTPAYPLVVNSASANAFIVDSSGNVTAGGDLTVSGNDIKDSGGTAIHFDGSQNIDVYGNIDMNGGNILDSTGELILSDDVRITGGLLKLFSPEGGKTDWRMTMNVEDADKMLIYGYDEGGAVGKPIGIGFSSQYLLVNPTADFYSTSDAIKLDAIGYTNFLFDDRIWVQADFITLADSDFSHHLNLYNDGASGWVYTNDTDLKIGTDGARGFAAIEIAGNSSDVTIVGDLTVSGTGDSSFAGDVGIGITNPTERLYISDGNLFVCTGGACPAFGFSGTGHLGVEATIKSEGNLTVNSGGVTWGSINKPTAYSQVCTVGGSCLGKYTGSTGNNTLCYWADADTITCVNAYSSGSGCWGTGGSCNSSCLYANRTSSYVVNTTIDCGSVSSCPVGATSYFNFTGACSGSGSGSCYKRSSPVTRYTTGYFSDWKVCEMPTSCTIGLYYATLSSVTTYTPTTCSWYTFTYGDADYEVR